MKTITSKVKWAENELSQNTHIVEFENCCVVIDAGISVEEVNRLTNKPIAAALITHGHFDHILEIESFSNKNIPIYAHKNIEKILTDEKMNVSMLFGQYQKFNVKNINFVENDKIYIGGHKIQCYHTPGHSIDGMSYKIDKNLFTGDTLFSVAIGRIDLPKSNKKDMVNSLKLLQELDYEIMYAGHGRASNKNEQNANINYWLNLISEENLKQ